LSLPFSPVLGGLAYAADAVDRPAPRGAGRLCSVLFLQQEGLGKKALHRGLDGLPDAGWVEVGSTRDAWENAGHRFKLHFRKVVGPELGRLTLPGGQGTSLGLVGGRPVPGKVAGGSIVYRNALPQVDLVFTLASDGFKESLVLWRMVGEPVYRFTLDLSGVVPEVTGGQVIFRDEVSGRPVFYIPAPFMTDAAGAVSTDIGLALEPGPSGTGFVLTLRPSVAWLTDPARVFPVTIDPSLALWPGELGFEPYWTYYDLSLDDRGSVSVNLYNGNLVLKYLDTYHAAQGPATFLERTYNSQDNTNGILGYSWVHNYFGFLLENADGTMTYTDTDGTRTIFSPNGDGTYAPPPGVFKKLTRQVDASGAVSFTLESIPSHLVETYDGSGNLVLRTDSNGNTTTFSYVDGALTSVTDASGGVTTFAYGGSDSGMVTVTDPAGRTFTYRRDAYGNLVSVTDPTGAVVTMTYDAPAHRLTGLTDATGRTTTFGYDTDGRVTSVTTADGATWTFSYDPVAGCTTVTTPLGQVWTYAFNPSANLVRLTDPEGLEANYLWDESRNLLLQATTPRGGTTSFTYNSWGQKLTETDPNGKVTTYEYDAHGNLVRVVDPEQVGLALTYDGNHNPTVLTDSAGNSVRLAYDNRGNNTAYTDGNGNVTSYAYDANGNLMSVVDPLGGTATYTYDAANNLTSAEITKDGALYFRASYTYDALDRIVSVTDALGNTTTNSYDANGNLMQVTRASGRTVGYIYGPTNSLLAVTHDRTQVAGFDYDASGRMVAMTLAGLSVPYTYAYNDQGRLVTATEPSGNRVDYTHDADGNVSRLDVTTGTQTYSVRFSYDLEGRLTSLTEPGGSVIGFSYGANDRLAGESLPNGITKTISYDQANRTTAVTHTDAAGSVLWSETYTYDAAGNRTAVTGQGGALTLYQYDALNRLVSETDPVTGHRTVYHYDPAGNRTAKEVYDAAGTLLTRTTYTYNLAGELVSVDGTPWVWDADGNLASDGTRTFTWDANSRLTEVRDAATGALIASFTYDGLGRRLSQTTPSGTTYYHYDGDKVAYETDETGTVIRAYTYGPTGLPVTMTYQGETYYYHTNDRGDVLGLTDASGALVASYRYDAWGNILEAAGPLAEVNPYRYCSYRYDDLLGAYALGARWYAPDAGRFFSEDPVAGYVRCGISLNPYVYCFDNPTALVDSDGRLPALVGLSLLAGAGDALVRVGMQVYHDVKAGKASSAGTYVGAVVTGMIEGAGTCAVDRVVAGKAGVLAAGAASVPISSFASKVGDAVGRGVDSLLSDMRNHKPNPPKGRDRQP